MKRPKVKVRFVKMGAAIPNGVNGVPFGEAFKKTGLVRVDPRQDNYEMLDTLIHEVLHVACPYMGEAHVTKTATMISEQLWKQKYRRCR